MTHVPHTTEQHNVIDTHATAKPGFGLRSDWQRALRSPLAALGIVIIAWIYAGEDPQRPLLKAALRGDAVELLGAFGWPTLRPIGIVIHHTATPDRLAGLPVTAAVIDTLHASRGYSTYFGGRAYHIGYHYVILPDGSIEPGRPEACQGAHTGNFDTNRRYLGIAVVGDFDSQTNPTGTRGRTAPTRAQAESLAQLTQALAAKYSIDPAFVVPHQHLDPGTRCPGDRLIVPTVAAE